MRAMSKVAMEAGKGNRDNAGAEANSLNRESTERKQSPNPEEDRSFQHFSRMLLVSVSTEADLRRS